MNSSESAYLNLLLPSTTDRINRPSFRFHFIGPPRTHSKLQQHTTGYSRQDEKKNNKIKFISFCAFLISDLLDYFKNTNITGNACIPDYAVPAYERRARAGIGSSSALTTLWCTSQKRTKQPGPPSRTSNERNLTAKPREKKHEKFSLFSVYWAHVLIMVKDGSRWKSIFNLLLQEDSKSSGHSKQGIWHSVVRDWKEQLNTDPSK